MRRITSISEPGLDVDAGTVAGRTRAWQLVGADNFAVEVLPFPAGTVFPVHQCLIRDFGIPLLEGLVLQAAGRDRPARIPVRRQPVADRRRHRESDRPMAIL